MDDELEGVLKRDAEGHTDVEQEWRLRAKATDNTSWTFLKIEQNKFGVYHLQDPEDWHHAAHRKYVDESVAEGNAATKQYVDDEIAKVGGGSFAETGSTTPPLSAGQLFYNTTDKVLYIGE